MADGDPHALGTVYDRHSAAIYSHVLPLVGSPAEAEEVVEEAFWSAWRNARSYEPEIASLSAWILSMARHRAVERRKAKKGTPPGGTGKGPDAVVTGLAAIDGLPEGQREPLSLAFLRAMSFDEIAEELGMPAGAVADSIRSGMEAVGAQLRPLPDISPVVEAQE